MLASARVPGAWLSGTTVRADGWKLALASFQTISADHCKVAGIMTGGEAAVTPCSNTFEIEEKISDQRLATTAFTRFAS